MPTVNADHTLEIGIKISFFTKTIQVYPYLPTPPLGQVMTQGQSLSGV